MRTKSKKINIQINGQKKEGYIIKLPPTQVPNDFYLTAEELEALYKLLTAYFSKKK